MNFEIVRFYLSNSDFDPQEQLMQQQYTSVERYISFTYELVQLYSRGSTTCRRFPGSVLRVSICNFVWCFLGVYVNECLGPHFLFSSGRGKLRPFEKKLVGILAIKIWKEGRKYLEPQETCRRERCESRV